MNSANHRRIAVIVLKTPEKEQQQKEKLKAEGK